MKHFYSFLMLALALTLGSANAFAQFIAVNPDAIRVDAQAYNGTLTVSYIGYDVSQYYQDIRFYDADGTTPVGFGTYAWLSNGIFFMYNNPYDLNYGFASNPGIARTAYLRVVLCEKNYPYAVIDSSNLITFYQDGADCPAPDHFALTEGSITSKGASFTWTGYSDNYQVYAELLNDPGEFNRVYEADFEEDGSYDLIPNYFEITEGYQGYYGDFYNMAHSGNRSIASWNHESGTTATLELYMNSQSTDMVISFWALLAAGEDNKGSFWIDGVKVLEISGAEFQTNDWTQYSFELSAYTSHTMEWKYEKNDDSHNGPDAFFIDDIVIYNAYEEVYILDPLYVSGSNTATLNSLAGGWTYRVYVKGNGNCGETGPSNALLFTTASDCPWQMPDHLTATNVTGTTADIRWAGYGYDHFDVYYADEELTQINSRTVQNVTSLTLTGLTPNTTYKVWIETTCDAPMAKGHSTRGIVSLQSDTMLLTTNCGVAFPYTEDFENCGANNTDGGIYGVVPECWYSYNETDYTWYSGYPTVQTTGYNFNGYSYSGEQHLCMNSHYANGYDYDYSNLYAILPVMDNLNTVTLSFYACHGRDSYGVQLHVGVMTDPEDIYTFETVETIDITGVNTDVWEDQYGNYQYYGYNQYTVDFSNYAGEGKHIAFMMEPANSSEMTHIIYIDDILCESSFVPSTPCPTPTGLAFSDVTTTSASLSWSSDGDISSYNVEYREGASISNSFFEETFDYLSWEQYADLVDDVLAGISQLVEEEYRWSNSSNVFESGVKLNIYGGDGNENKHWLVSPELSLPADAAMTFDLALTSYGNSNPASGTCEDDRFVVLIYADGQWNKLREWNNSGSTYVYNDIATTGENAFIDLSAYGNKNVKIAFYGESTVGGNGDNDLHIDNVAIGTAVGEWQSAGNTTNNSTTLSDLTPGVRYEVRIQGDCDGEGTSAWSEPVTFTTIPSCPMVSGIKVVQTTKNSATIAWNAGGEESSWDIYITDNANDVPDANTAPTEEYTDYNPYTAENLSPATTYYVYVRAVCDEYERSAWSSSATAMTKCEAMGLPYECGFEDYNEFQYCWSVLNTVTYNDIYTTNSFIPYEGSRHLDLWRGSSSGTQIAILPEVQDDYDLKNYEISFYAKTKKIANGCQNFVGSLHVGVMSDPNNASTFVQIGDEITLTDDYTQYSVNLGSYTGNDHYLAIKTTSVECGDLFLDNVKVSLATPNSYTITAAANPAEGGSVEGAGTYDYGTEITLTATANTGYTFVEWNDGITENPRNITVSCDSNFVAKFTANSYTLTYMDGNDVLGEQTYAFGATVTSIAEPTKAGYTFTGWNPELPATMPAENVTVYAQWQINTYTVTATANPTESGSVEGAGTYDYGTEITLTATANTGYTFVEWNDGITENPRNVTVSCDSNFVANFATNSYTLTYMDGNNVLDEQTYAFGATVTPIAEPTKVGYTFTGWDPAVPATMPAENVTVYAQWQINSYTVTATANPAEGGSVEGAGSYDYGTEITLTATANTGYTFVEWNDGITENPRNITVSCDSNFVANFATNSYTLTYMDGNNVLDEQTYAFGATVTPIAEPTKVGYTFTGWDPAVPATMPAENVTVYAQWQINSYTVTATANPAEGGSVEGAGTYDYGTEITLTATANTGYTFVEWNDGITENPRNITVSRDSNFVAKFTANSYTLTYMDGNDVLGEQTYAFGATVTPIAEPTKEGYTFTGWNPAVPATMPAENVTVFAQWQINSYTVTAAANPTEGGSVEGAGSYDYGTEITLIATPATGYVFTNWTKDGVVVSSDATYTFTVEADGDYVANFATNSYTLTYMDGNDVLGEQTYAFGATVTPIAEPTKVGYTFTGWDPEVPVTMPAEDLTVFAQWQINSYTVNATVNPAEGGSVEGAGSYDYGTEITLTATANTGYTFVEWNDGITENPRNVTVSRDSNFVAKFTANSYTLTYMDGNNMLDEQTYAFGATVTPIAEPTKVGYTFTGWNPAVPATMPAENVTVYAQWQVNSYTVTAAANPTEGGSVEGAGSYDYGTEITLIATPATGYVFTNWTKDGAVVSSDAAYTFTVEADGDYVANFATNAYTLTYMDGNDVLGEQTYAFGATVTPIAEPTKDGYTFTGWNPAVPATMPAENVTVFAQWQINSYTVTATANPAEGGSVEGAGSYDYGTEITLTATANTGYTFVEWNDGITENPRNVTVSRDSNFVANFATNSYTLTYMDGNDVLGEQTYAFGATVTPIAEPTKEGYTFTGWNPAVPATMPAENVTVYAQWQINSYTVTATANPAEGGSVEGAGSYDYGTEITLTATANTGYTFVEWNDGITENPRNVTVSRDSNFVANFTTNAYTLTYMDGINVLGEQTYAFGATVTPIAEPTKEGYTFTGWNPAVPVTMPAENVTVYAQWQINTYTVTATANPTEGGSVEGAGTYDYGTEITLTATANTGYTFVEWNDGITENPRNVTVSRDSNFVANFTTNAYTLTYMDGNDVLGEQTYAFGATVTPIAEPTKVGYTFTGWNPAVPATMPAENVTVYAQWQVNSYTVTAAANPTEGGSVEGAGTYDYGTEITLTATPATGYVFTNWTKDGVVVSSDATYTFTVEADGDYVANFATNAYTLTYMDGNDVLGEQTYAFGATVTPIAEPTKVGYTFTGWNPAVPATMPAENVTVYAQWQVNSYTVTAAANPTEGGSVEGAGSYDYGTEITLTATANTGYTFVEWNDGITENPRNVTVSRDSNFVANFTTNAYTLTYMDGNDVLGEQTYAFGATVTPIAEPTKEGYTFTGWNPAVPATMPAEDLTVYAQWQINSYTISVTANPTEGGSVEGMAGSDAFVNGTAYDYGTEITLTATPAEGYLFTNWTLNGVEVSTAATYEFMVEADGDYIANFDIAVSVALIASDNTICDGGEVTLSASIDNYNLENLTYEWYTTNGTTETQIIGATQPTLVVYPSATTNYKVYVLQNFSERVASDEITITVITLEPINITTTPSDVVCDGGRITLTADNIGEGIYSWFRNGQLIPDATLNTITDSVSTIDNDVTTYNYNVTFSSIIPGCQQTASTIVTAYPSPTVTITGESVIYNNTNVVLTANVSDVMSTASYTYQWMLSGQEIASETNRTLDKYYTSNDEPYIFMVKISNEVTGCAAVSEPYYVTVNDTASLLPTMYEITVVAEPAEGGMVDGAGTYEEGQTATLTATANTGFTFTNWTLNGVVVSTDAAYTFTVEADGDYVANFAINAYTLTYMDGNNVLDEQTYAFGATVTPIAEPTKEGYTFTGWNPAVPATMPAENVTVYAQWQVNSYTVTAAANPAEGGSVEGAGSYDYGTEITLTATPATGYVFTNWTKGGVVVSSDAAYTFTVEADGDYVANFDIAVSVALIASDITICEGGEVTLSANLDNYNFENLSYEWYTTNGTDETQIIGATGSTLTAIPSASTTYKVYVLLNASERVASDEITITVITLEPINITTTPSDVVCDGGRITLTADNIGEGIYSWFRNGQLIPDATLNTITDSVFTIDNDVTTYNYNVVYSSEMPGCQQSASTVVMVYPSPTVTITGEPVIFNNTNVVLTAEASDVMSTATYSYQWMLGGEDIAGEVNSTLDKYYESDENPYSFTVSITNEVTGCTAVSEPYYVTVNDTASLLPTMYEITVVAEPAEGGMVDGAGTYEQGETVTLTATANTGFTFINWTLNGVVVSTDATYSFTVEADGDYVANFAINSYTITYMDGNDVLEVRNFDFGQRITPIADPIKVGYTFIGWNPELPEFMPAEDLTVYAQWQINTYTITYMDDNDVLDVQTYDFGQSITPIADPEREGFTFIGWDPELPNVMPAENLTVFAQWQINSYTVTVVSNNDDMGTVTGGGTFDYGSTANLTATAYENYTFIGWSDAETADTRVITVTRDSNLTAYFIPAETEEIEIEVNDTTMGSVTLNFAGGGPATVNSMVEISATPEPHYHFVSWSDGNTDNPRMVTLMEALNLTAIFAIDQHTITVLSADENMGTVSIGGTFDYGTEISISADALQGYEFVQWNDGNTDNPRTITVEQDSTFTAYFQFIDGINDPDMPAISIYSSDNRIVVANAEGFPVQIFDMSGRLIVRESRISESVREYTIFAPGVYLVKVGDNVVKKVTIITR